MGVRFVYHEFRRTAKLWKKWKICFKLQLWMWLVDLSHNFECDWLIELTGNNLASEFAKSSSKRKFWIWFLFKDKYISVIFVLGLEDFPFWFGNGERKTEYRRFAFLEKKNLRPFSFPAFSFFFRSPSISAWHGLRLCKTETQLLAPSSTHKIMSPLI